MPDEKIKLSPRTEKFISDFFVAIIDHKQKNDSEINKDINSTALIYERLRVAMEYQEEHLIFKNAIARILRRKYTLVPNIKAKVLLADLMRELAWANYIKLESFDDAKIAAMQGIVSRYLLVLQNLNSGLYSKIDLTKKIVDFLACEFEDFIKPKNEREVLITFALDLLEENLNLNTKKVDSEQSKLLLKYTIYTLIYKPDKSLAEYYLLNNIFPNFKKYTEEESIKFGRSIEPYLNKIEKYMKHPLRMEYTRYAKKYVPAFVVIDRTLENNTILPEVIKSEPKKFEKENLTVYKSLISSARNKVWRGTLRALLFILLTKIILAFIIEVPFEQRFIGAINYLSLVINVALPPLLMLVAGSFVKSPPKRNLRLVTEAVYNILYQAKVGSKKNDLVPKRKSSLAFDLIYRIFNLVILFGSVYLLIFLQFSIVSIFLFFFFVSLVSFFSFRIRNIALELAMERASEDAITSFMEFLLLPFIRMGRYISNRFTSLNPFILILDFLIEAPLKTILRLLNLWRGFVNAKKEELEY